ncbi:DUF5675 family protein [Vibrio scophthalmi]|uniref:DUF5675 family protein n=1 Tax=Vibrio scophthalmi TaxID=45658 RepID=UPI003AAAE5E8
MKTLTLHRNYFPHGTFSILTDENGSELVKTVERSWNNNAPGRSCIPEGTYELVQHQSPKFGKCLALVAPELGVTIHGPSLRTHILFHPANLAEQLEGCVAPGFSFGVLRNQWAVLDSTSAMGALMQYLNGENAQLIIKRA